MLDRHAKDHRDGDKVGDGSRKVPGPLESTEAINRNATTPGEFRLGEWSFGIQAPFRADMQRERARGRRRIGGFLFEAHMI